MKKALSVLLVAAALFGFYGSAVTVNDLLACKDYWEEAGEKSTADMNKLEDGLNQLKDNEQAYLDGIQQVADGEVALADGEAQYAQGLADYAAAPGKLADARRQLAEGKDDLAEGKEQLDGLTTLIKYLTDVENKYKTWKKTYTTLTQDREAASGAITEDVADALLNDFKPNIEAAMGAAMATKFEYAVNALQDNDASLLAQEAKDTAKENIGFMNAAGSVAGAVTTVQETVQGYIDTIGDEDSGMIKALDSYIANHSRNQGSEESDEDYDKRDEDLISFINTNAAAINQFTQGQVGSYVTEISNATSPLSSEQMQKVGGIKGGLASASSTMKDTYIDNEEVNKAVATLGGFFSKYQNGKVDPQSGSTLSSIIMEDLAGANGGQGYMATVMQGVASNVLGNDTLKDAVKEKMGAQGIALLTYLKSEALFPKSDDYPNGVKFGVFAYQMETDPGILSALGQAKNMLIKARSDGYNTYNEGKAKYNKGLAQYNQGLADYAAAPGKLADAEQQLADGRKQLEDGKAQLAQYEDGEQQIRDGLATLFNTEADLDLVSIADRLNGDGDFDNGDNHLEIEEGLNAVEVGRGYQAEDGVLITNEIMGRAVATGGLLAAAVLAVLAAILSFLNKNKGAGVFAILAAVAGAFGAFYGPAQGTYFSEIAGSTIGTTTWVAAGVLGAVALVHAIAHFAAKKAA